MLRRSGRTGITEIALAGAVADRSVEVELLGGAFAGEAAQAAQRDLHVARAELLGAGEILEVAPVPDLDRAAVAALLLADAHPLRVVAIGAERRRARRADPFGAALVAALLLGEPLAQGLHQLFEAERLQLGLFLRGKIALGELAQPFLRDVLPFDRLGQRQNSLERAAANTTSNLMRLRSSPTSSARDSDGRNPRRIFPRGRFPAPASARDIRAA